MREFCIALLATVCLLSGLLLRYSAIESVVTAEKKRTLIICYAVALILSLAGFTAWNLTFGTSVGAVKYGGVLFAVVTAGINILVVRHHVKEHVFAFGIVIVCNYLLLSIPSYITHLLEQRGVVFNGVGGLLTYALLLLLSYFPMRKLLKHTVEPFLRMENARYWDTTWFIPLALFGMLFLSYPGGQTVNSLRQVLGGVLCAAVMILVCLKIAADHRKMLEKQIMEQQLAGQKIYYAKLQAKIEETRKVSHDYKHYAQALRHYLSSDDMEGLRACCIELTERLNQASVASNAGNSVADAVIYRYVELAHQEQILVKVQGELICDWIADMDICVILGNLLDNAIEGCKTVKEDRRLSVTFQNTETTVCILVQNTYDGVVTMEDGEVLSRKREKLSGVGLRSVEKQCQKYHGEMDICPAQNVFSVNLLLQKPQ